MKTKLHRSFVALAWLALSTLNLQLSTAHAQGTAFTYQGQLNVAGNPANGSYDLQFTLYNASTNGTALGSLTNAATTVGNSLFTATLDFGSVFAGSNYWLELAVRTNGSGVFSTLSPRQPITPSPQAIYAANSGNAAFAIQAASAATATTASTIGGVASANVAQLNLPNTNIQATGTVIVTSGFITGANLINGGSGYTNAPSVTVTDVSGSNAVITATVSNGVVVTLTVQIAGSHYSTGATLTIAPPPSNAYQTFGSGNVFNGVNTFNNSSNTFAGSFTGNASGSFIGNGSGLTNLNLTGPSANAALGNTANGFQALHSNTTGYWNTANGYQALFSNTTGHGNVANGAVTLYSNTTGNNNTANGNWSLNANTTGSDNTANGDWALQNNTTGNYNTASGVNALVSNTSGNNNAANGYQALNSNTTGSNNTANGSQALYANTSGNWNSANGSGALQNNTSGSFNAASGVSALFKNTTGSYNTAIGNSALYASTTAGGNTASGSGALYWDTNGNNNTADGNSALHSNTSGAQNTASGAGALQNNTSGSNNIALGYQAGYNITTGSSNIDIGNVGLATDTNTIRIGSSQSQAFIAGVITGDGSGLANLNASQLATGTIADSRLSANVALLNGSPNFSGTVTAPSFSGNGSGLTNLSASAVTGGLTINIAVLVPGGGTNTLCFTNGILIRIQ